MYTLDVRVPTSTLHDVDSTPTRPAAVWARRAFLAALLVVVLLGLVGLLGVHSTTASASQDGWTVDVEYAGIARAGLDVPWTVKVTHPGGFGDQVVLAVKASYFEIYETQGWQPSPSDETRDGDTWYLTFNAPEGDTFVVAFDAYIQPSSQRGREGWVAVMDSGRRLATVPFRTVLLP